MWTKSPVRMLESCARSYGDCFTLKLGSLGPVVIVAAPDALRQIFAARPGQYTSREYNINYRVVMGENALFLQDGARHKALRREVMRALRDVDLVAHGATVIGVTRQWLDSLPASEPTPLRPATHRIALGGLLGFAFGDDSAAAREISTLFSERVWRDLRDWKPWTMVNRAHAEIRAQVDAHVDRCRAAPPAQAPADVLGALALAATEDGTPLAPADIQDQFLLMTVSAGDAVALALAWALARLARAPGIQERLRGDLEALGPEASPRQIAALPYLDAVFRETVRLHPVLATTSGRRLSRAERIAGYDFPAGTMLAPCQYLAHRNPEVFPEPERFRPERFLDVQYAAHHYFPFGGGPRSCLGWAIAPLTVKLALATVLSRHRIAPVGEALPPAVRMGTLLAPHPEAAIRLVADDT